MKSIITIAALFMIFQSNAQNTEVQRIVDACIEKHGGDNYKNANFAYDFRKNHFEYNYNNGKYRYELHSKDGKTKDILTNEGFKRLVNGKEVSLSEKKRKAYSSTVNSVHYFVFLPFFLNDGAVNKELHGEATVNGKDYYKVKVTFDKEGGGVDHDDIHMYWINKDDYTMDYMAYAFEVNGGGVRFRSSFNKRMIGGILFQDYVNFKHDKDTPVEELDALFEADKLTQVSVIETVNVEKK